MSLKDLHQDPDRIRKPLVRQDGKLVSASWEEALELVNRRLKDVSHASGDGSVAVYVGNPTAHNFGLSAGIAPLLRSLGTRSLFTAGTVDQVPKHLASELMFGNDMAIPVPDILHCDLLVMLGANPVVSNGSLWIVPKFRDKLRDLQKRGGRLVTVDPRRNETARLADQHIYIRPGADAVLLMAIIQRLLGKGLSVDGKYKVSGEAALFGSIRGFPLDDIEALTGISEDAVSALADDIAGASNPVIYGRVGTTLQTYGTLTSFLIEVVNLLTDSLDREGGAMFPEQPYATPSAPKRGLEYNRYQTRVSGMPEVTGQLPVSALAEEIETEGEGQIRALVTLAGNPVVSNPDSERLQKAFESLDFMVSLDIYHNETTRLADVVLPGSSPFEDVHYDAFLGSMGYKNAARYSPALISGTSEWQTMLTLSAIAATGSVPDATALAEFEDNVIAGAVAGYCADETGPLHGRDAQEIMAMIEPESGIERLLDLGIRAGRWGDHFGKQDGLTLKQLADTPNGVDLGALRSGRLPEVVRHPDTVINLAPEVILAEISRLKDFEPGELSLIGKRKPQANNSWLRNLPVQGRGKQACHLEIHHDTARALDIADGDKVRVSSSVGEVTAVAELSEDIAPWVVSMPHGYSEVAGLMQAQNVSGPNYNVLAPAGRFDGPSGTTALNGIPVTVSRI
ncbi:MAG: molybdopterin-dependent oxidoreductase [Pseudomonadales bacterium]|nr:molybdopterin-dependent oxidoreductase [Pseudomonadales bacterium]